MKSTLLPIFSLLSFLHLAWTDRRRRLPPLWGFFVFARMQSKTSYQKSARLTLCTCSQGHFYCNKLLFILIIFILRDWAFIFRNSVESKNKRSRVSCSGSGVRYHSCASPDLLGNRFVNMLKSNKPQSEGYKQVQCLKWKKNKQIIEAINFRRNWVQEIGRKAILSKASIFFGNPLKSW